MGPVALDVAAYSSLGFNDNIFLTQSNPQSDIIVGVGVEFDFAWSATDQSQVRLGSSIGYSDYLRKTLTNSIAISPNSALSWAISFEDGSITFFNQFSYTREVITEAAVSGVGSIPRFENTLGARLTWQPKLWLTELSYSYNNYLSDESSFEYLNRNSQYVFLRFARAFAENTQAGIETSASFTDYWQPTQSDNNGFSIGPYAEWQITRFISASLHGGPTVYIFSPNSLGLGGKTLHAYYLDGKLTYKMTDFLYHQLDIRQGISLGLNQGSEYIEQLTLSYSLNWNIIESWNLGLGLIYEHGSQPLREIIPYDTEIFSRYGFNLSASYSITKKFSANLFYSHWDRVSNLRNRGYLQNNIILGVQYAF